MVNKPKLSINTERDGLCFGCGQDNPIGLKLHFIRESETVRAEFTPGKIYQGWPGVVHGGIITSMLDEAMSHAAYFTGMNCITAKIEIHFRQPARVEETLIITARITRNTRKIIQSEARVTLNDGTIIAEGIGTQYVIDKVPGEASNV